MLMSNPARGRGRPSGTGRYREPTRVMRVPESRVEAVRAYLDALPPRADGTGAVLLGRPQASAIPPPRRLARMVWPVRAGFPSPAEDDQEEAIDLNALLAPNAEATFLLRVSGLSMSEAGIDDGDVLVVDRALEPAHGRIVVAVVDGEFTVKRLHRRDGRIALEAAHPDYPPILLSEGQELSVWGVVTRVIKSV
ncbi:DNA polymerase V [Thiocapsa sp. KS1]|nr:DNA polymerase V [Thiocapsa sp. KS1]